MQSLVRQVFHYFLRMGGFGLVGFGILDSSFLFLPLGNDLLLVVLTARKPAMFWYYALMATLGSAIGCTLTDAVSRKTRRGRYREDDQSGAFESRSETNREARMVGAWDGCSSPASPFPSRSFSPQPQDSRCRGESSPQLLSVAWFAFSRWRCSGWRTGRQILRTSRRPEVEYFMIGLAAVSIIGSVLSILKWVRSTRHKQARTAYAEG